MKSMLTTTAMLCLIAVSPAMAQSSQDSAAKQVHDEGKDGMNSIATTEDQTFSGHGPSVDPSQVHDQVQDAAKQGAGVFDSVTSQFR